MNTREYIKSIYTRTLDIPFIYELTGMMFYDDEGYLEVQEQLVCEYLVEQGEI